MEHIKNGIVYRVAVHENEIDVLQKLIIRVYLEKEYLNETSFEEFSKINSFLRSSFSVTFGAYIDTIAIGTITVVEDSSEGLPMDSIFKNELQFLRQKGFRLAEGCQFAIDKSLLKDHIPKLLSGVTEASMSAQLLSLTIHYAISRHIDYICLAVNPKHKIFYESIGCERVGSEKQYPSVNNAPALAYTLDIKSFTEKVKQGAKNHWSLRGLIENPPDYRIFDNIEKK